MAQVGDSGEGPNVELNLVPFIDLMSVLITFLLITAVWTQVSMIQIGSSVYGKKQEDQDPPPPEEDKLLRLDIKKNEYFLRYGSQPYRFPKKGNEYDVKSLRAKLKEIKTKDPEKKDAMVSVEDNLDFETFIKGMDILIQEKFPNIGVVTGEVK